MYKAISTHEFSKEVTGSPKLSLVKFKAEWSGACHIMEPMFNDLSNSYRGMVNFFTVDTEQEKLLNDTYGIMELPTILFFKSDKVIDHITGLTSKNALITKIEKAIAAMSN
jgi:thioredoxin 1